MTLPKVMDLLLELFMTFHYFRPVYNASRSRCRISSSLFELILRYIMQRLQIAEHLRLIAPADHWRKLEIEGVQWHSPAVFLTERLPRKITLAQFGLCFLSRRKLANPRHHLESMPEFINFCTSRSCGTTSNAVAKSVTTASTLPPASISSARSWNSVTTWLSHD